MFLSFSYAFHSPHDTYHDQFGWARPHRDSGNGVGRTKIHIRKGSPLTSIHNVTCAIKELRHDADSEFTVACRGSDHVYPTPKHVHHWPCRLIIDPIWRASHSAYRSEPECRVEETPGHSRASLVEYLPIAALSCIYAVVRHHDLSHQIIDSSVKCLIAHVWNFRCRE